MPRWDRYEDLLLDAMQVLPLGAEAGVPGRAYRALYCPAFHDLVCVTTYDYDGLDQGTVEAVVAGQQLSVRVMRQIGVRFDAGEVWPETAADLYGERAAVSAEALQRIRQQLAGVHANLLPDTMDDAGLDGLIVRGEILEGTAFHTFHTWSPSVERYPAHCRYCIALLDLARAWLPGERIQRSLQAIRSYLRES